MTAASFVDRAAALLVWASVVVANHPVESVVAAAVALFVAMAAYKTTLRAEAWVSRRLAEHRLCRDVEAMWAQVDEILADAEPLPDLVLLDRPASPRHVIKRRRMPGVRIPRRRVRRPSTSNSERH